MSPHNSRGEPSERIVVEETSLANLVLETIHQLRSMVGETSADPELAGFEVREISLSIPFESEMAASLPVLDGARTFTLAEASTYLTENDRQVRLEFPRLSQQPSSRLSRLNLRIRL